MKKILLVMLALVLVIISGMLVFESDQKEQRQQKHILKLQKEAEPYESELQEIRQDLEERSVQSTVVRIFRVQWWDLL